MNNKLEHEFFRLIKSDKHKAIQMVFEAYWNPLFKHAIKSVHCKCLAQDLVQDTFISLWDNLEILNFNKSVLAYLYAILKNKTLKFYEKDEVRSRYAISMASFGIASDSNTQNIIIEKELTLIINAEIEKMPKRMKEIYMLKKEDDLSIKQIASGLSLSEQTIKNQLQMAYQRLRTKIV
ncbi:sigma-70 family RNA polymerase sigma factor [Pedobacter paludis]|uniref:RNA polymerase subunit sigma-70 n=1 Tax=Pedobacter paludis TaxID=2203212 RepID=A0A317F2S0_9SPHI|nr:sigma-70 family RNA polymerase sigma factor [Pedobacter paludis]PWS33411.1 hypothetical protein DF947_01950 [Pedobacter paludis]